MRENRIYSPTNIIENLCQCRWKYNYLAIFVLFPFFVVLFYFIHCTKAYAKATDKYTRTLLSFFIIFCWNFLNNIQSRVELDVNVFVCSQIEFIWRFNSFKDCFEEERIDWSALFFRNIGKHETGKLKLKIQFVATYTYAPYKGQFEWPKSDFWKEKFIMGKLRKRKTWIFRKFHKNNEFENSDFWLKIEKLKILAN